MSAWNQHVAVPDVTLDIAYECCHIAACVEWCAFQQKDSSSIGQSSQGTEADYGRVLPKENFKMINAIYQWVQLNTVL